mmetsp:Transcript_28049/g.38775  ORF Transcript_28049/g.38775 Transcript_28049/m.38775 type:complete len:217 (+) Transcript_28049:454-1104(+)
MVMLVTATSNLRALIRRTSGMFSSCRSLNPPPPMATSSPSREYRSSPSCSRPPSQRSLGVVLGFQEKVDAKATTPPLQTTPWGPPKRPRSALGEMSFSMSWETTTRSNSPRAGDRHMASICLKETLSRFTEESTTATMLEPNSPSSCLKSVSLPLSRIELAASSSEALWSIPRTSGQNRASSKHVPPTAHPTSSARFLLSLFWSKTLVTRQARRSG